MSDSLTAWQVQVADAGPYGPWTAVAGSPAPSTSRSLNDTTQPQPNLWYRLLQTTTNGAVLPYNIAFLTVLEPGVLSVTFDYATNTLNFTWSDPDAAEQSVLAFFYFECRDPNDEDIPENWSFVDLPDPSARSASVAAFGGLIYRLRGICL